MSNGFIAFEDFHDKFDLQITLLELITILEGLIF